MSAVWPAAQTADAAPAGGHLAHIGSAWRSLGARELGCFMLLGSILAGINLISLTERALAISSSRVMLSETLCPLLWALVLMLFWLPADRSSLESASRPRRLAAAVILATVVGAIVIPQLMRLLDLPTALQALYQHKGKPPPGWLAIFLGDSLSTFIPGGLAVAVLEMAGRHRRSERAVSLALDEHARLARATLESRLSAMQAQVEPRFLFDVLVDIERLYGLGAATATTADRSAAAAQMERLITYLRVALPKLREAGSTVDAEVDLLASYLDLVQAMHGGQPQYTIRVPDDLSNETFHPMLLLPLVQRSLRNEATLPQRIDLSASGDGSRLRLVLTIAAPALCHDDDELQRLRERLQVLYEGQARLFCEDLPAPIGSPTSLRLSRFTLEVPT